MASGSGLLCMLLKPPLTPPPGVRRLLHVFVCVAPVSHLQFVLFTFEPDRGSGLPVTLESVWHHFGEASVNWIDLFTVNTAL